MPKPGPGTTYRSSSESKSCPVSGSLLCRGTARWPDDPFKPGRFQGRFNSGGSLGGGIVKHRKGMLIGPLPTNASLTPAIVFFSRQRMHEVLDSIWPVFCMPVHGAALVSGNTHGTSPWRIAHESSAAALHGSLRCRVTCRPLLPPIGRGPTVHSEASDGI